MMVFRNKGCVGSDVSSSLLMTTFLISAERRQKKRLSISTTETRNDSQILLCTLWREVEIWSFLIDLSELRER